MSLNRTGIEYLTHTWTIYSGCENWHNGICGGGGQEFNCWAKGLFEGRLKRLYRYGFKPTVHPERLGDPMKVKKPARVGVAFMGDLFGDWMNEDRVVFDSAAGALRSGKAIMNNILGVVERCPQHTFVFLTKCPQNLARWNPWPGNCWVGASATNQEMADLAIGALRTVQARVRFISFEPLLERIEEPSCSYLPAFNFSCLDLVILGGKSGKSKFYPPEEWIQEIEAEADRLGIPVFEKDNLRPKGAWLREPRGELPNGH